MRAINKGSVPLVNGIPKKVSDYKDWRQDLIDRIGNYCCYCNMRLNDSPQVEHVVPKNPQPGHAAGSMLDWDNMLLGCGPCNRAKSNNPVSSATHYLPDVANTHLVFDYVVRNHPTKPNAVGCVPVVSVGPNVDSTKAVNTIKLCGLDKISVNARATDLRWQYRYEALLWAKVWKKQWDDWGYNNSNGFIDLLIIQIQAIGFFSIWLRTFENDQAVLEAIVSRISGNNLSCYDNRTFASIPIGLP